MLPNLVEQDILLVGNDSERNTYDSTVNILLLELPCNFNA